MVTRIMFNIDQPQILGATVQNSVAPATCCLRFMSLNSSEISFSWNTWNFFTTSWNY